MSTNLIFFSRFTIAYLIFAENSIIMNQNIIKLIILNQNLLKIKCYI
jgi:hypothetical protein